MHFAVIELYFSPPSNLRSLRFSNLMISSGGGASTTRATMPSTSAFWLPGKIPRWSPGRYLTSEFASQESLIRRVVRLRQENTHGEIYLKSQDFLYRNRIHFLESGAKNYGLFARFSESFGLPPFMETFTNYNK